MQTFRDTQGRSWHVVINIGAVLRVRDAVGVDLLKPEGVDTPGEPPLAQRLLSDDLLLMKVVGAILAPDLEAAGVNKTAFYDAIGGATLLDIRNAFIQELSDFFTGANQTDRVTLLLVQAEVLKAYHKEAKEIYEREGKARLDGGIYGTPPAESDSTPAPSPTGK